ncbi:MAG: hypothetical protein ACPG5P_04650 [Saprospiraceae bacterium]
MPSLKVKEENLYAFIMLTSQSIIQADTQKVWDILKDKVFNPIAYIPGIENFEIKERAENEHIRTLFMELDDVIELIIINEEEKTITSSFVRHGFLKGTLLNKVEKTKEGTLLIFEQDREITIEELKDMDMQPALDAAVQQIKELAEA